MKVLHERKKANINGKDIEYDSFSVKLDLPNVGEYVMNLPIETKGEKEIVKQLIDSADFQLQVKTREDGNIILKPVIVVQLSAPVIIPVQLKVDSLMLVRVALGC